MARYRTITPLFIAPEYIGAETEFTINDSWVPNLHVEPLDGAAEAAMAAYLTARPELQVAAIDNEPLTFSVSERRVLKNEEINISLPEAQAGKAAAGPTDGGKLPAPK